MTAKAHALSQDKINKIVISRHHSQPSILSINQCPERVCIVRFIKNYSDDMLSVEKNNINFIGWAEIHTSRQSI